MTLLGLLVALIIIALLYWAIVSILGAFGLGDPIATLVKVVFVILVVLWLLSAFGFVGSVPLRLR